MPTTNAETEKGTVRQTTIFVGTDERGRDYVYRTQSDTVHVIDGTERPVVDQLDGIHLNDVVATVHDEIGWETVEYGVLAHRKDTVPPKWAGRR